MDDVHKMTANQKKTYRNHNGSTTSYCAISIFGLRPPELLGVFRNPIDYYRYCCIDERKILSEDLVQNLLSNNVWSCKWVDCLGRRVKIRKRAFGEVRSMLRNNLNDLEGLEDSSQSNFDISMNEIILEMIESSEVSETDSSNDEGGWSHKELSAFVDFNDSEKHLPIPVTTNSTPFNPHNFIIHVLLSLGKYETDPELKTAKVLAVREPRLVRAS